MIGKTAKEALDIETESAQQVEAAVVEQQRGETNLSAGLLLQAIDKERQSLDLIEQGMEDLKQALAERRRALEQQESVLSQFLSQK